MDEHQIEMHYFRLPPASGLGQPCPAAGPGDPGGGGAYQLGEVLATSRRLTARDIPHTTVYLLEPGRFRAPRSAAEQAHQAAASVREALFPPQVPCRLLVTHTRPEAILGLLGALHTGPQTGGLGYLNQGGTLDTSGMLFVNRCSWAHCLAEVVRLLTLPREHLLSAGELQALDGIISPHGVIIPEIAGEGERS